MFGRILNMPMYLKVLLSLHSYFRFCFRHVQTCSACSGIYSKHILTYSDIFWHIPITKHIQTLQYIYNTIINIFIKAQSWTFVTVLNRCYLTSRVTLRYLLRYVSEIFRHIQEFFIHI